MYAQFPIGRAKLILVKTLIQQISQVKSVFADLSPPSPSSALRNSSWWWQIHRLAECILNIHMLENIQDIS